MIPMFWPHIPQAEILEELAKVFGTRWIGQGPKVEEFEEKLSGYIGNDLCVTTNSGTSALDLAYDCVGLKSGDDVITPVLTCTATNHPLLRRGCNLKFTDIDPNTLLPNLEHIRSMINDDTKAIVVTHLGGKIVDISQLMEFGIPIIEDACQAFGGKYYNGTMVGDSGNYVVFSFQAIKHITTGDGGCLFLPNKEKYNEAKRKRWFGIDREKKISCGWDPMRDRQMCFDVDEIGYKYQMNDIAAAIGVVQMRHIQRVLDTNWYNYGLYESMLLEVEEIQQLYTREGEACWLFGALFDRRDELQRFLKKNGIETNLVQVRNDIYKVFGGNRQELQHMNNIEDRYLYLPLHCKIGETEIMEVCGKIRDFYGY